MMYSMKLFRRLLNASILNAVILYRNNTGKGTVQLSFRIQLLEGLFVKCANTVESKMPGRHSSDNTVPHLTGRHFISKIAPTEKKPRPQRLLCVRSAGRGRTLCTSVKWDSAWNVFMTITPSSISNVVQYNYS
jgi:hypothetical protein